MSRRILLGRERTAARRVVEKFASYEPTVVARLLSMRKHTIAAILSRRMLPGRSFYERTSRLLQ